MLAAKRLMQKAVNLHHQSNVQHGSLKPEDLDLQIGIHYGIPSTASLLAFDPIQRLLAIGTLDGRIKVIGGDGIEGLFMSPKQLPCKYIEFLQNWGFLVSISNDNEIQVWNMESRCLACCLQWESNITAFSVISGSYFMYIGDEYGLMSVLKYDAESNKLLWLPYQIPANSLKEAAGFPSFDHQPIVGVLPQPCSSGNRVLIAYENGLMILWDVSEARILFVGGGKDLQLKDEILASQNEVEMDLSENTIHNVQEKEISALCWASSNGSILAVGYVDGDILFWKTSMASFTTGQQDEFSGSNVVKLQLSSAVRRLPVIILQWSPSKRSSNHCNGQLFIYGGEEIGSEEVLTVLTLEWSTKMETLTCAGRLDLTLTGSFADMVLLPGPGSRGGNDDAALFVLTNPGQLHLYDDASISALLSQQEKNTYASAVEFPAVVPTAEPAITVTKLAALPTGERSSKILSELASVKKQGSTPAQVGGSKWPLTGGVPSKLSFTEHPGVERVYIAGYQDGSVRLWNATYSFLSLICVLAGKVQGVNVADFCSSVSSLDFCFCTLNLAVGNECGLVRIYNLSSSPDEKSFVFVTNTKHEVHILPKVEGPQCRAVFSLLNSPIRALQFANSGAKLAVGFGNGRVAVLNMSSLSVLFFRDCVSGSLSPVISLTWIEYIDPHSLVKSPKHSELNIPVNHTEEVIFFLTRDATLNFIDGGSGSMICSGPWHPKKKSIAISMYLVDDSTKLSGSTDGKQLEESGKDEDSKNRSIHKTTTTGISSHGSEQYSSSGIALRRGGVTDSYILLCCEDSLCLYFTKDVIQGSNKTICKVKHAKHCCWTSTFKKDGKLCGLVLLFQTGVIEIRSFPDLELVKETSAMSILRWNFKANMEKMMSSSDNGHITLANGCELAFVTLLSGENCFRIPESSPCLHDKVLAAAADAAFSFSSNQKKKQGAKTGILGNIVKGFKAEKIDHNVDITLTPQSDFTHLEGAFLKPPFSSLPPTLIDSEDVVELNIDDIEIDEPPQTKSAGSSQELKNIKEKGTEREQLLGMTDDMTPKRRTPEEIIAKYRKAGDASSVAAHARNKLVERQEKLEKISRRTAELQSGAEDFASLANELVKAMENRKWYQI